MENWTAAGLLIGLVKISHTDSGDATPYQERRNNGAKLTWIQFGWDFQDCQVSTDWFGQDQGWALCNVIYHEYYIPHHMEM